MDRSGRILIVLLTLGAFGLPGVAQASSDAENKAQSKSTVKRLIDSSYRSISVEGTPGIGPRSVEMSFFLHTSRPRQESGRPTVSFSAGCNYFGSKFRVSQGRLALYGASPGTDMGCEVNHDVWLIRKLRKSVKITLTDRRLILSRPSEGLKIVLREVTGYRPARQKVEIPATEAKLQGRAFRSHWTSRLKLGTTAKLRFSVDESQSILSARLDCNRANGRFKLKRNRLIWTNYSQTKMGCLDSNERVLFEFLSSRPKITFTDSNRLIIWKGDKRLGLVQVKP